MAYPVAATHPQLSGSYIPIVFASLLVVEFYSVTVLAEISNTDYQGDIKDQGDTVRIRTLPDISINDYVKGQALNYQTPAPSYVELLIDKGKYIGIAINDLDRLQSDIEYQTKWSQHGAEKMKIEVDKGVLQDIYDDVHADNTGNAAGKESGDINLGVSGTPFAFTSTNSVDKIVDCSTVLDEQNVPESERFIVLPPWACARIKTSELKDASLTRDGSSTLRSGKVGMVDRFTIYSSNNLKKTADGGGSTAWSGVFGQKSALTFALQLTKNETLRNPNDFGDLMRSLMVYGYKVVKSEALGHLYVDKA